MGALAQQWIVLAILEIRFIENVDLTNGGKNCSQSPHNRQVTLSRTLNSCDK